MVFDWDFLRVHFQQILILYPGLILFSFSFGISPGEERASCLIHISLNLSIGSETAGRSFPILILFPDLRLLGDQEMNLN